jgi:5'(3')-deoxyribonucleotidase
MNFVTKIFGYVDYYPYICIMKKILYIDMDGVMCDFYGAYKIAIKKNPYNGFPQSEYGFFTNLEPMEGAIEAVKWLMDSEAFDTYILTAPSIMNPLCYTEKRMWIEKYFGMELVKKLIISPNKGLNKGDFLVDDNTSGRGQSNFEGELIHFGSEEYKDWKEVLIYLNKQ